MIKFSEKIVKKLSDILKYLAFKLGMPAAYELEGYKIELFKNGMLKFKGEKEDNLKTEGLLNLNYFIKI